MLIRVGDFVAEHYEVRRKADNKRLNKVQIADNERGYYERFKIDENDEMIFDTKLNLYEREYIREPIKFVRNTAYLVILIGLFKRFFQDVGKFIEIETNVRKSKEEQNG